MPNRRHFVRTVGCAAAGVFAAGVKIVDTRARSSQAGPAKRREVFVGRRRVKVVDVHGHFIEPAELDVIKIRTWPGTSETTSMDHSSWVQVVSRRWTNKASMFRR